MKPQMPAELKVIRRGGSTRLFVDGVEFPWYFAHPTTVCLDHHNGPGVTITLIAESVVVDDQMLKKPETEPAS